MPKRGRDNAVKMKKKKASLKYNYIIFLFYSQSKT